jgi:hypothetical protein
MFICPINLSTFIFQFNRCLATLSLVHYEQAMAVWLCLYGLLI